MKIIAEHLIDLGDAGQHKATAVGYCRSSGGQVHTLVESVTIEVKGSPEINIWPFLKADPEIAAEVESWLLDVFDQRCKSVIEAIKEMEYRERTEARCDV